MKRLFFAVPVLLGCLLTAAAYPGGGMGGLLAGVGLRNPPAPFLAEFAASSALVFALSGQGERYLRGFGVLCLVRRGRRALLRRAVLGILLWAAGLAALRLGLCAAVTGLLGGPWDADPRAVLRFACLYALAMAHLGLLELAWELALSAGAGLLAANGYLILSVAAGGLLLGRGAALPCLLLTANLYMGDRAEVLLKLLGRRPAVLYGAALGHLALLLLICRGLLRRKDIY